MNRDDATRHPVEALSAFNDGELGGAERRALEEHLHACAGCRDLLEDLKAIDREVAGEAVPAAPPDLARRIAAALPRRETAISPPAPARRAWFRAPMPLAAAASLMVATLVWLAWPGGRSMRMPASDEGQVTAPVPATAPENAPASTADEIAVLSAPSPTPAQAPDQAEPEKAAGPPSESKSRPDDARRQARRAAPIAGTPRTENAPAPSALKEKDVEAGDLHQLTIEESAELAKVAEIAKRAKIAEIAAGAGGARGNLPEAGVVGAAAAVEKSEPTDQRPWPALRADAYTVRLVAQQAMRVESGPYACTVDLEPEDVQRLQMEYRLLHLSQGQVSPARELTEAIRVTGRTDAAPPAPKAAAPQGTAAETPGYTVDVPPESRQRLLALVRERYRAALEERCGPLPH